MRTLTLTRRVRSLTPHLSSPRIWPTGGWGSIEYGTVGFTPGQVEGGRWKPLQYFYKRYIYKDELIAASADARVFIKNDNAFAPLVGTGSLSLLHVATGTRTPVFTYPINLPRGGGQSTWFCANSTVDVLTTACPPWPTILAAAGCATDGSDCIALLAIADATGTQVVDNFELLNVPSQYTLPAAQVTFAIGAPAADGTVPITLTASATALFVTLTTLAQGRFSDNALLLTPGATTVSFIPWAGFDAAQLASSLRVEHVASYARN
jgi:beta-mannosidase